MSASDYVIHISAFDVPMVPAKYVSWASATIEVGRHFYRDDWDDAEKARSSYLPQDRAAEIQNIVEKRFPTPRMTKAPPSPHGAKPSTGTQIAPEALERIKAAGRERRAQIDAYALEVAAGLPTILELVAVNNERKKRLAKAQEELFAAMMNGGVPGYWYKDKSANLPVEIPAGELVKAWGSLDGQGSLRRRGYIWRDRSAWFVYLDTAKMAERFPMNVQPKEVAPAGIDPADLSEYMQLALYVARLGYGARYTGLKDDIKAKLVKHADQFGLGDDRLTPAITEQLATVLRNKEAQGGMAGPLRARKNK
jgi:hypothetical protein